MKQSNKASAVKNKSLSFKRSFDDLIIWKMRIIKFQNCWNFMWENCSVMKHILPSDSVEDPRSVGPTFLPSDSGETCRRYI